MLIVPESRIEKLEERFFRTQQKQLKELVRVRKRYLYILRLRSLNPFFHARKLYRRAKRWAKNR